MFTKGARVLAIGVATAALALAAGFGRQTAAGVESLPRAGDALATRTKPPDPKPKPKPKPRYELARRLAPDGDSRLRTPREPNSGKVRLGRTKPPDEKDRPKPKRDERDTPVRYARTA